VSQEELNSAGFLNQLHDIAKDMLFLQQLGLPVRLCSVILYCFIVHAKPEQSHGVFSLYLYLSNYLEAYNTIISIVTTVRMMVVLTVVILFFSLFCFKFPLFL